MPGQSDYRATREKGVLRRTATRRRPSGVSGGCSNCLLSEPFDTQEVINATAFVFVCVPARGHIRVCVCV